MQELGRINLLDRQVFEIGVVYLPHLAQFLHGYPERRLARGGVDRCYTGLVDVVAVDINTAGRYDFQWLHGNGVEDDEMRRPVSATNNVFAVTGYRDVTRVVSHLGFCNQHAAGLLPQVDLGHLAVTALGVPETSGDTANRLFEVVMFGCLDDVYRVAGIDMVDDFVLVAVDNGNLAGVTLDHHEKVFPVTSMQWLARVVFGLDVNLVPFLHQRQRHFRWYRWLHLDVTSQQVDFFIAEDIVKVIHTTFGAYLDDLGKPLGAEFQGALGLLLLVTLWQQALARGAFSQYPVTTGTTLEVHAFRLFEFSLVKWLELFLGGKSYSRCGSQPDTRGQQNRSVYDFLFNAHRSCS